MPERRISQPEPCAVQRPSTEKRESSQEGCFFKKTRGSEKWDFMFRNKTVCMFVRMAGGGGKTFVRISKMHRVGLCGWLVRKTGLVCTETTIDARQRSTLFSSVGIGEPFVCLCHCPPHLIVLQQQSQMGAFPSPPSTCKALYVQN